jgi:hypothetical protein
MLANCIRVFRSVNRHRRWKTSEVYSGRTGCSYTIYITVLLFFSKGVLVLLCRFVPAIRYSPDEESGAAAAVGFSWQGLPDF